ncbi:MAG TPA: 3-oxoacyl-[acyl-carrier-protein] synthase III C-terminal domain-containing protein [Polyangiaceae bacterium]|nr:3-oxoacyl-[acyl-carrier-protein] synthase III C-terminal domain-containing protein [Polyangiaceae bacterium]
MRASVAGIGVWFPERVRENSDWPEEFRARSAERLGDRTLVDIPTGEDDRFSRIAMRHLKSEAGDPFLGTTRRRISDEGVSGRDAETYAAHAALKDAGVDAADVDVILSWAIVPDRIVPSNACHVGHAIGARRAWSMGVDAACASVVTQLTMAASLIESGRASTVLLTQSHWVTRAMPMMHPASPNVGDGAAAMVVRAGETAGIHATVAVTEGQHYDAVTWCRGRTRAEDPPWWEPGGAFYLGSLTPEAAQLLMRNTIRIGVGTVEDLMQRARMPVSSIDVLACVQPRRWVPSGIAEGLGLAEERAPQTFDEYAHLGGVGVVANLLVARERGALIPGARVAIYAQGAGFTRAAALLTW